MTGLSLGFVTLAMAQDVRTILKLSGASFDEHFDPSGARGFKVKAAASGDPSRILLGLHLGQAAGDFDINKIQVKLPGNLKDKNFCVRIGSGDGGYNASNLYNRSTETTSAAVVENKSKFTDKLASTYKSTDVPIRIVARNSCDGIEDGALIPAIPPGASHSNDLVAYINSGTSLAEMELLAKGKIVAKATCAPPGNDAVKEFTAVCVIRGEDYVKTHPDGLQVTLLDGIGSSFIKYQLEMADK